MNTDRLRRLTPWDWLYALTLAIGCGTAFSRFHTYMDSYEAAILALTGAALLWLGWSWKPLRLFFVGAGTLALIGIAVYQGDAARGDSAFLLKYALSSQTAILWMCALYFLATLTYWLGLLARSEFAAASGSSMTWAATLMGFTGLLVRWYESYLKGLDIGHIPVSNLYEVFVLFCLLTALIHLYYEQRHQTRSLGAFVLLVVTAAAGFLLWYAGSRDAHEIQPLVPALQSWWMKLHVPANFVGYGAFAFAAMVAVADLLVGRGILASRLPRPEVLDEVMYKAIAIGFAFFTIATILGALWAAEAWGTYWQWDPKETWAFIVWLNYAAWLHIRLTRRLRGTLLAWWALIGLLVTSFAFLGVNMFLSGLHSYGAL